MILKTTKMEHLAIINQREIEVNNLISAFILSQDVTASSKRQYKNSLQQYFRWVDKKKYNLNQLSRTEILEYKADLLATGMSALTVGSYLCSCRKFYEYAEGLKIYPNIARGIKSPKRKNAFRKMPLLPKQCNELLAYFKTQSPRDYAIVNLLLRTGLRTIEVIRADVGDLQIRNGQRILMVQGKGHFDHDDFVCISEGCFKAISDTLLLRGRLSLLEPLFCSTSNNNQQGRLTTQSISCMVKKGLRTINLNDRSLTAHSLRHSCATNLLRAGASIIQVQQVLRHRSVVTTQLYTQSISDQQRLENPCELLLDKVYEV
jgi:integrase/recombinase XerC/integrase/recombinase XerD